ncbi:Zinc/iron permease [Macrolepiota fuliginosa MF-IS2]|uniref:Zinc/iron permease n=1 Tax=Macrolepiota fuliginosa MF-IS2 TaxID=1400762 RepID=A0A9P5X2X0_9AGAR|nr:Zinc/iron permease [Macrolepiota fuliginosa MF-IS2]
MSVAFLTIPGDSGSDEQPVEPRIQVMLIVLVISLFAVSFPGVSKTISFLRIPHIVFFIGKHFGTGVILATAFIHLLQDSFEALQKRQVKEYFNNIGKYTGLIILASLLTIFLIEYLSTSYVDHLHAEPSLPPTPVSSRPLTPQHSRRSTLKSSQAPAIISISQIPPSPNGPSQQGDITTIHLPRADESTPLLRLPRTQSTPHIAQPHLHAHTHARYTHLPAVVTQDAAGVIPIGILTNLPQIIKMRGCTCVAGHACTCPAEVLDTPLSKDSIARDRSRSRSKLRVGATAPGSSVLGLDQADDGEEVRSKRGEEREDKPRIGRRRQVIGLLVLQLGIMIHSIVIGLTLAITTGSDFTSLTTAVIFHQLFEGLSLGIRIAALPPPPAKDDAASCDEESLSAGGFKSESGTRRSFVKSLMTKVGGKRGEGWLKCTLVVLFAITTPVGIGLGMVAFKVGKKKEGFELARMYLTQGLMSAISAGMLIYASTVEMLAGDFVFGDIEGHSHHDHGHSHSLPFATEEEERTTRTRGKTRSNSRCRDEGGDVVGDTETVDEALEVNEEHYHHHHHLGKIGKKVLAVVSLLAGVGGMVLIGLGE